MSGPQMLLLILIEIVNDQRLNRAQVILYSLINSGNHCHGDGRYCNFTNSHFSRLMEISKSSIPRHLKVLENCGLIERQVIRDEKTNEVIERRIFIL